ncbi:MAG TPA: PQQ-binding-like beta-propeller repeat protein [Candidatus Acidoferrum sp.]|nr:PQQ-binding-like beta-propeller repeat protein [Candidatus Acidoferrum sp.]
MNRGCVLTALLAGCCGAAAADWPQWRGPNRDGISAETVRTNWPAAGPATLWRAAVGTGFSGVSISRGRACTLGNTANHDTAWCLDALSGKALWKHTYPSELGPQYYEGGPGSTPTVDGDRLFTISKWGDVFCLDAVSGKVVWHRDLRQDGIKPNRWGFAGSPLVWHDLVILNAGSAGTALDRATGRLAWCNGTNAAGYASPVLFRCDGRDLVLIFAAKHLVALDPRNGNALWQQLWETGWDTNNPDPLVQSNRVFISSFSRGCALLAVENGTPRLLYDSKVLFNNLSPGVRLGEYLYAFSGEAHMDTDLRCIHLPTGELKWARKDPTFGSLLCAGGKLIVLSEKGELMVAAASPAGLQPLARAKVLSGVCWTPPALANGLLYVRNAKGELRCLDLR